MIELVSRIVSTLLLSALLAGPHAQQQDDFFTYTPEGWEKWQSEDGQWTLWLPEGTTMGEQRVFFVQAAGDRRDDWLPVWLGGTEVDWQGELASGGVTWSGKLAGDETRRGLVAVSEAGDFVVSGFGGAQSRPQSNDWSLAALAPAGEWETRAAAFNAILRGEP
jgi:hypothetical protein